MVVSLCDPVMAWQPMQCVPLLLPSGSLNRLQIPVTLDCIKQVLKIDGWMDGRMSVNSDLNKHNCQPSTEMSSCCPHNGTKVSHH